MTISEVVLVTTDSALVFLALVRNLAGRTLASHFGHEFLDDVGDLVCVSGVDRAFFTVHHVALDIQLILFFLVFEISILLNLVEAIGLRISLARHNSCHSVELFLVWSRSIRLYFDFFIFYRDSMNRLLNFLHVMLVLNPYLTSLAKIDIAFSAVESGSFNIL